MKFTHPDGWSITLPDKYTAWASGHDFHVKVDRPQLRRLDGIGACPVPTDFSSQDDYMTAHAQWRQRLNLTHRIVLRALDGILAGFKISFLTDAFDGPILVVGKDESAKT